MPRQPRVFIEGGTYHVYCRASRGEVVFADQAEATAFVRVLGKVKERDGLRRVGGRGAEQAAVVAGGSGRACVAPRRRGLRRLPRTEHGPRAAAADG